MLTHNYNQVWLHVYRVQHHLPIGLPYPWLNRHEGIEGAAKAPQAAITVDCAF
jgi:hypothetical protein